MWEYWQLISILTTKTDLPNEELLRVLTNVITNEVNMKQPSNKQHYIAMIKTAILASGLLWFGITALLTLMGY